MTATLQAPLSAPSQQEPRPARRWGAIVAVAAVIALAAVAAVLVLQPLSARLAVRDYPLPPLQDAQQTCQAGAFDPDGALVVDVVPGDLAGLNCLAARLRMPADGQAALASAVDSAVQHQHSGRPVGWWGIAADVTPYGDGARVRFVVVESYTYSRLQLA